MTTRGSGAFENLVFDTSPHASLWRPKWGNQGVCACLDLDANDYTTLKQGQIDLTFSEDCVRINSGGISENTGGAGGGAGGGADGGAGGGSAGGVRERNDCRRACFGARVCVRIHVCILAV